MVAYLKANINEYQHQYSDKLQIYDVKLVQPLKNDTE